MNIDRLKHRITKLKGQIEHLEEKGHTKSSSYDTKKYKLKEAEIKFNLWNEQLEKKEIKEQNRKESNRKKILIDFKKN